MEKLKSSLTNMVLVLVGVSLAIGAILAYVNHVTEDPISQKAQQALAQGIKNVMGAEDLQVDDPEERKENIDGKETVFVLHHCRDNQGKYMGAAVESTTGGFAGDLKVLVGFEAAYWVTLSCKPRKLRDWEPRRTNGSRKGERVT